LANQVVTLDDKEAMAHLTRNQDLPDDRRMLFRIGVYLRDVIEQDDGAIYGDGVNVAARLESLAEPGGICLSGSAHEQVEGKTDLGFQDIGEHKVGNAGQSLKAGGSVDEIESVEGVNTDARVRCFAGLPEFHGMARLLARHAQHRSRKLHHREHTGWLSFSRVHIVFFYLL